jgi:hypothetical protein
VESEELGGAAALSWTDSGWPEARGKPAADSAAAAVAALYQHHAVGLIRLAYVRSSVLNSCRSALRRRTTGRRPITARSSW